MTRTKRLFVLVLAVFALGIGVIAMTACNTSRVAYADGPAVEQIVESVNEEEGEIEPYGLYTSVKVYLTGGNGEVWATAKNTFTLFPSTVHVYVELYSSDTYQDDYTAMTLMATNYSADLNMGKSIEARTSTGGVQKYWKARVHFNADGSDWKDAVTKTMLLNADGISI